MAVAQRYTTVAIALHWAIAAAIVFQLGLGLYMTRLPEGEVMRVFTLYQLHKSVGVSILLLSLLRLAWRMTHPAPPLPDGMKPWERSAARATHWGFYVIMLGMPLTGWALVSVAPLNIPTVLFKTVPWPHLPIRGWFADPKAGEALFDAIHTGMAVLAMGLLALHVGAALKHHFIARDDVLARMLPLLRRRD